MRVRLLLRNGQEVDAQVRGGVLPYGPMQRQTLLVHLPRAPVLLAAGSFDVLPSTGLLEKTDAAPGVPARRELHQETGLPVRELVECGERLDFAPSLHGANRVISEDLHEK